MTLALPDSRNTDSLMLLLVAYLPYAVLAAIAVYGIARIARSIESRRVDVRAMESLVSRVGALEDEVERLQRSRENLNAAEGFDRALGVRSDLRRSE